jgi:nucleoside-diphosphate-sugar epimerase
MMRILMLGGTRFIGPPVVRSLVESGHEVTVFHRGKSHAELPPGAAHLHGDRKTLDDHLNELRRFAPEVVLGMIALTEADGRQLVEAFSGVARRVVAVSSCDVYRAYDRFRGKAPGPPDAAPLSEDAPLREHLYPYREADTPPEHLFYHYDKILMERAVRSAGDVLPATVIRLPIVYGPGDYQHRLYPYLRRMDEGRPMILLAGEQAGHRLPRGYVEDVGRAIALCVTAEEAAGKVYHVAEAPATEAEWVARLATATGWAGEIVTHPNAELPEPLRQPYDFAQDWSLDTTRIRTELGYTETTAPDEALRRTLTWERANPPAQPDAALFNYAAEDAALVDAKHTGPAHSRSETR